MVLPRQAHYAPRKMDGWSDGDIGVGGTGTVVLTGPDAGDAEAALAAAGAEAMAVPLAPAAGRFGLTSRFRPRISLRTPDGGALTTVGRRLRSIAANLAFCSGDSCWYACQAFWRACDGSAFDTW